MKVMITGGAGFIGSHIVDLLINKGYSVIVIDNLSTGKTSNVHMDAKLIQIDILDPQLDNLMAEEMPEVIIHQAAMVYIQQSIKNPISDGMVNAIGTLKVLQSAARHKVRKIIYASTCAVYGEALLTAIKEDYPVLPMSFYGVSKYAGEMYILLFHELLNLDYTILRYTNVYGPRQLPHGEGGVIPIFIQKMSKGISPAIFGDGRQSRDFIHVKDVAKANLSAILGGSQQTYNIGTGISTTINDLNKWLSYIMNFKLTARYLPEKKGDVKHICLDPSKAKDQLYWEPTVSIREGLKELDNSKLNIDF